MGLGGNFAADRKGWHSWQSQREAVRPIRSSKSHSFIASSASAVIVSCKMVSCRGNEQQGRIVRGVLCLHSLKA